MEPRLERSERLYFIAMLGCGKSRCVSDRFIPMRLLEFTSGFVGLIELLAFL